jgi:hypothetical protein
VTRTDYVLAVMAAAQAPLTPVQVQKTFFILDKKVGQQLGGPHFDFQPYNYGPFDPTVYHELENLAARGLAFVDGPGTSRRYGVTPGGMQVGLNLLARLDAADYFLKITDFVRSMSFAQLVSAVYAEWPEMKAKSIFRG